MSVAVEKLGNWAVCVHESLRGKYGDIKDIKKVKKIKRVPSPARSNAQLLASGRASPEGARTDRLARRNVE